MSHQITNIVENNCTRNKSDTIVFHTLLRTKHGIREMMDIMHTKWINP